MTNNIPRERDITRVQLWERIDGVYGTISNTAKEIYAQIDNIKQFIAGEMTEIISDNKKTMDQSKSQLNDLYLVFRKDLQKIIDQSSGDMQGKFTIEIRNFDQRFSELLDSIPKTIYLQMEERMGHLSEMTEKITTSTEQFSNTTKKEINQYQVETKTKVSGLNNKLETILRKFKLISNELS